MRKTNEMQMRFGLNAISVLLPSSDFYGAYYSEIANRKRFLYYYKDVLHISLCCNNPNIPKRAKIIPILKKYMNYNNKNMELVDDYINILLKDCNPMKYSESIQNIGDIQTICDIGHISPTTVINYRSLSRLIPKFKTAVTCGTITIPIAVDLAKLDDLSQYEVFRKFLDKGIDLTQQKVNYRLLSIAVNAKILNLAPALTINFTA